MGKEYLPNIADTLQTLIEYLTDCEVNVILEKGTAKILGNTNLPFFASDELGKHADLLIVVGGDGSLLSAARVAVSQDLPVLGINRGRLGFLTDITPNNITKIAAILHGEYFAEERFLLKVEAFHKETLLGQGLSLNDAVLLSQSVGHMAEFAVCIDNQAVCSYHADGLIVATPTGSTAHALSCNGPILHPALNAVVLVPMLSHNLSSRSIAISSDSVIKILIAESNRVAVQINCDGQNSIFVPAGGYINICKAKEKLKLLHPKDYNYFETLRAKLHWEK